MKRLIVACAVIAVAMFAAGAWSASGPTPTEQRLLRDVAALKTQVKALQGLDKKQNTAIDTVGALGATGILLAACSSVITADELQGTWQVVDQLSTATQAGKTYFGPQTPIAVQLGGQDICAANFNVVRSQLLPPTIGPYQALLAPLSGSNLRLYAQGLHLKQ